MSSAREVAEQLFDLQEAGRIMHESWMVTKRSHGFHGPYESCPINWPEVSDGQCPKYHADLKPWWELPQKQKDINLNAFREVFARLIPKAEEALEAYAASQVQAERERLAQQAEKELWHKTGIKTFAAWLRSQG